MAIVLALGPGGCSLSRSKDALAKMEDDDITGSRGEVQSGRPGPTESDLAFAGNAASDVLTRGDKDSSQPWDNRATGARGSVTALTPACQSDGLTCRDFLASYVNGRTEDWLQGTACQTGWDAPGYSHLEAMETGLSLSGAVAKMSGTHQMKWNRGKQPKT